MELDWNNSQIQLKFSFDGISWNLLSDNYVLSHGTTLENLNLTSIPNDQDNLVMIGKGFFNSGLNSNLIGNDIFDTVYNGGNGNLGVSQYDYLRINDDDVNNLTNTITTSIATSTETTTLIETTTSTETTIQTETTTTTNPETTITSTETIENTGHITTTVFSETTITQTTDTASVNYSIFAIISLMILPVIGLKRREKTE